MDHLLSLFVIMGVLFCVVLGEGALAYKDRMLYPEQLALQGYGHGLPFIGHLGASWGDMILVTPLVTTIVCEYGRQWSMSECAAYAGISAIVSCVLHFWWAHDPSPVWLARNKRLTPAGWVHLSYMIMALAVILLFYFRTARISPYFLIACTIVLAIHALLATHIQLDIAKPRWWKARPLSYPITWITIALTWTLLYLRCRAILRH